MEKKCPDAQTASLPHLASALTLSAGGDPHQGSPFVFEDALEHMVVVAFCGSHLGAIFALVDPRVVGIKLLCPVLENLFLDMALNQVSCAVHCAVVPCTLSLGRDGEPLESLHGI